MRLVVARIGRAHGIRGEVTIEVRTDRPEDRFRPGAQVFPVGRSPRTHLLDAGAPGSSAAGTLRIRSVRDHNGVLLLSFDGVGDRSAAEELRGLLLEAEIDQDEQEPDAWYDHQLVGLHAVDPSGRVLGDVVAIEHPGAQDRLIVRRPDGTDRMVPFVTAIVPVVDVQAGTVLIDAPPGLLDELED